MKKEKTKKESKLKKKIKELNSTPRGKAILKLIGWIIFFTVLFIFAFVSSLVAPKKSEPKEPVKISEKEVTLTIYDDLKHLFNSNFEYQYDIVLKEEVIPLETASDDSKTLETHIYFNGKVNNNIEEGYKETDDGITKYYIDNTGVYEVTINNKVLTTDLYKDLEEKYFNRTELLHILSKINYDKNENIYSFKSDMIEYQIEVENDLISKIIIIEQNKIYNFTYKGVEE